MSKYLCIPSPDGLRLEEVNPYPKYNSYPIRSTKWEIFEHNKRSFLTDAPRVVVGQQYPADEYETVWQYEYEGKWYDEHDNERNYLNSTVRQILRRKAEGEKDRQRRGINDVFEAENVWNIAREQFKNVPDDGLFPNHTDQDVWTKGFVDGYEYLLNQKKP